MSTEENAAEDLSIRDTLAEAISEVKESEPAATPAPATQKTEAELTDDGPTPGVEPAKGRDESGRFKKAARKRGEASPVVTPEPVAARRTDAPAAALPEKPGEVVGLNPETPALKPPQAWKPMAREKWAGVPAEVQQEVARREKEIATTLQEVAPLKQHFQAFQSVTAPFESMIRSQGGDVMRTVGNLLQTQAVLQMGSAQQKAGVLASVIKNFAVDIPMLAAALDGQPMPQGQPQQSHLDPQAMAQQIEQRILGQFAQQRQQASLAKATSEIEEFSKSHDFFDDVREDMADLIEAAHRRGVVLSPEDAYTRAVRMNPELWEVVQQRQQAQQAKAQSASTQQARNAASSVRSQPAGLSQRQEPEDIRAALQQSLRELANR